MNGMRLARSRAGMRSSEAFDLNPNIVNQASGNAQLKDRKI